MAANGILGGFTQDERARFEEALAERRRLLLGDLQALETGEAGAAEFPPPSSQPADLGADGEAADIRLGRRQSESTEVREIDDALDRLRDGTFGSCESCEQPIPKPRLEAIPYARLCLPCKKAEEA